ncbi:mannitol dehydrogenase family protein [Chelatococcus asaccharovorans]|uniref:mannitol dehydrogenase family protein n=1 Tax=Chelatococcus asaccharovorans TaxID=28210 RepID=UPI00224C7528|nr:mannitol dehydrogenase family protein [Chelatococcus asaccharovorans]CAH1658854.1 D-mannonate oxidoreductase [Chelatococcus asaccharovorans]CAH1684377.1 D-mannonate oxidoreductase [Chelatococcus asaccharovorans]
MTHPPRLNAARLGGLPAAIERPTYDRAQVRCGIVHLGIGAFHRAHQAVYTEDVLKSGDLAWGIVGASLRSPDTRDALAPQDSLYTIAVRETGGETLRVVGSILEVVVAPEDPEALIARMSDPEVAIVSLTVTEKGYCHDPATGRLDEAHPDVVHDLANPHRPRSALGFITAAIARRQAAGTRPFTVMSCDNLPANGQTLKGILSRFADLVSADLGQYVREAISCPDTMIDRIVPATTDADRSHVAGVLGLTDAWPIMTEPFTQWVIEDHFVSGRPAWETVGATLVKDVAPYEAMKLRLLNGSHSALSYLGYLAGYETVAEAMADAAIAAYVAALMEDSTVTLTLPEGADVAGYKRSLVERFRNTALKHRTWQIAMDGSQKLPQRLLGTIRDRLARGLPVERHALAVAAWMRYVTGIDEDGQPIDVRDPLAAEFRSLADAAGQDADKLAASLIGVRAVFGEDLASNAVFRTAVTAALGSLFDKGAKATVATYG